MENPQDGMTRTKFKGLRNRGKSWNCEARWNGDEDSRVQFSPPKWFCQAKGIAETKRLMAWYFDAVSHYKMHSRRERHFNYGDLHEKLFGSDNSLPQEAQDKTGFQAFIEERVAKTWEQVQTKPEDEQKCRKRHRLLEAGLDQPEGCLLIISDNHINTSNSGPAAEESPPAEPMVDAGRNIQAAPDEIVVVQSTSFTADWFSNKLETPAVNDVMITPNSLPGWTSRFEIADGTILSTEASVSSEHPGSNTIFNLLTKGRNCLSDKTLLFELNEYDEQQRRSIKELKEEVKHQKVMISELSKGNERLQNSFDFSCLPRANTHESLKDIFAAVDNYFE